MGKTKRCLLDLLLAALHPQDRTGSRSRSTRETP